MATDPSCRDCGSDLELGFVPDVTHGAVLEMHWHPESPEKVTFLGMDSGTRIAKGRMLPIRAWRCPDCGIVSLYAHPNPPRKPGD